MNKKPSSGLIAFSLITAAIASSFVYLGTALTGLLLFTWLGLGVSRVVRMRSWVHYPLGFWMLAYLAWLGLSVWWSTIPGTSWLAAWVLAGLPITYLAWGMNPNPEKLWGRLQTALLLVGPAFAMWGLGQVILGYGHGQPVGPLVDKNAFAALMNLFWFFASVHFIGKASGRGLSWRMALPALGLLLIALTLFAAESRGATLTWLLLMPVLLWASFRGARSKHAVIAVLMIALTGYLGAANLLGLDVGHRTLKLGEDASTSARLLMWKSAAQIALDHPVTGTGWGTFAAHYPAYRDLNENTTSGVSAHNDYVQFAAEGGFPALLLLLGVLAGLLLYLKCALALKQHPPAFEAVGLLLGVLALFIHASLNFIFNFAFMNILAGLFLARAIQLIRPLGVGLINLDMLAPIGRATKLIIASCAALLLAGPLLLHLLAQSTLTGSQPGLALLRAAWPTASAFQIASLITAFRPSSGIAQELILSASEEVLKNSDGVSMEGVSLQRVVLEEVLERYELRRLQTNNSPAYGVREARVLTQYRDLQGAAGALSRAREILEKNLQLDPFHVDSMIELSRLDVVEGRPLRAQQLLTTSLQHVLSRRDQQLLLVEVLRQKVVPRTIAELDALERELRSVRSDSETGEALILPANFSENIDARLAVIAGSL